MGEAAIGFIRSNCLLEKRKSPGRPVGGGRVLRGGGD